MKIDKKIFRESGTKQGALLLVLLMVLLVLLPCTRSLAANRVDIDVVPEGLSTPVDTLYDGQPYELRVFIENDVYLGGISLGWLFWSPDAVTWDFTNVGTSTFAPATPHGGTFVTGVPGSRWMSGVATDGSCWDLGGTLVNDQLAPNQTLIGGAGLAGGLSAGPLEHMYSLHFIAQAPLGLHTLIVDSCFYPPMGNFVFSSGGNCIYPEALWGSSGREWVVVGPEPDVWVTYDPVFLVCPAGDAPFNMYLWDADTLPVVGDSSFWIEFSGCDQIQPCPGSTDEFTTIYPVNRSGEDGRLSFYIGGGGCDTDCYATIYSPEGVFGTVPVRALDRDGDFLVVPGYDINSSADCNDYDGNGTFNSDDVGILTDHTDHDCDPDPCELFGVDLALNPPENHTPGQGIVLEVEIANNNLSDSCDITSVSFYHSKAETGVDPVFLQSVFPDTILGPGDMIMVGIPYVVPEWEDGCIYARISTPCCSTTVDDEECLDMIRHCNPGVNACYQFHIALNQIPVMDRILAQDSLPQGWYVADFYEPSYPLYSPDTVSFKICTPNLSDLGDRGKIIYTVCYDSDSCLQNHPFIMEVYITPQSGDVNGDCNINIGDAVHLINYIFKGGNPPVKEKAGDPDCSAAVNVADAVFLINYIFKNGPPPCVPD